MKIRINFIRDKEPISFTRIDNEIIKAKDLDYKEKMVYIWLMHHKNGFIFNKSFAYKGLKMNCRTFENCLSTLHDKGYIVYSESEISIIKGSAFN